MKNRLLKVAVVSDLHAYVKKEGSYAPSRLQMGAEDNQPSRHPIAGLRHLIMDKSLEVDIVLCGGDMGDKAHPEATQYVWEKLQTIKNDLKAKYLIATAGNHDVDSRHQHNSYDASGILKSLTPTFPGFPQEELCDKFWARNFATLEEDNWRILVLNSSAYHGQGSDQPLEYSQGRVSKSTLAAIQSSLKKSSPKPLNLLLCHHHPLRNDSIAHEDYSEMQGGAELLDLLGQGDYGQWIIVHGHKHYPRVIYGPGHSSAPVIFSAGSLCANLYPEAATKVRNQFHIIEFDLNAQTNLGMDIAGKIHSWDWIDLSGWQPATPQSGLPDICGFGKKISSIKAFASLIQQKLLEKNQVYFEWSEVLQVIPDLNYLLPPDLKSVLKELQINGFCISYDENQKISQVVLSK